MARNKKYVPYKNGQILLTNPVADGGRGKVKILKYNGDKHYRILVYYANAHDVAFKVFPHVHSSVFERYNFKLTLSNTLKRL